MRRNRERAGNLKGLYQAGMFFSFSIHPLFNSPTAISKTHQWCERLTKRLKFGRVHTYSDFVMLLEAEGVEGWMLSAS